MTKITMSEEDLEQAAIDGVWYPVCPYCEAYTLAEPDAQLVYCANCDQLIEVDNPYV